jgi:hypothetical protein
MGLRSILECAFETRRGVQIALADNARVGGEPRVWSRSRRNGETGLQPDRLEARAIVVALTFLSRPPILNDAYD